MACCAVINIQNMLKCMCEIKEITTGFRDTLIEHSSNKNTFVVMLFILEHNTSTMGSMKSIIGKHFGKFQVAF